MEHALAILYTLGIFLNRGKEMKESLNHLQLEREEEDETYAIKWKAILKNI